MSEDAFILDGEVFCDEHAPEGAECFPDGGGEADTPQHCGECHRPLGNSLTNDGVLYVLDAAREELSRGADKYLEVQPCYIGTFYENSPHVAIIRDWMEPLQWYGGLTPKEESFISRFISWTAHMERKRVS